MTSIDFVRALPFLSSICTYKTEFLSISAAIFHAPDDGNNPTASFLVFCAFFLSFYDCLSICLPLVFLLFHCYSIAAKARVVRFPLSTSFASLFPRLTNALSSKDIATNSRLLTHILLGQIEEISGDGDERRRLE
jgi:hypothetical protein